MKGRTGVCDLVEASNGGTGDERLAYSSTWIHTEFSWQVSAQKYKTQINAAVHDTQEILDFLGVSAL